MPSTEEVIARLGQTQFLSKFYQANWFHQVPMADDSKGLTTFSCKFGKYRYLRMPFGLNNTPSTFQVMMQHCLLPLEVFSSPYMDGVIIFSQTWQDNLSHLSQVLSCLLIVKQSKCQWVGTKFEFLGYVVGESSLSIPRARIEKFKLYVKPATKKQLRSFIGLCGY